MALFGGTEERLRKERLRILEDKRVRFAGELQKRGIALEESVVLSLDRGGVLSLGRIGGKIALIVGPDFGGDGEFVYEEYESIPVCVEHFLIESEGLGGALGFGKKGQRGYEVTITRTDGAYTFPIAMNRNCSRMYKPGKNPLLDTRRRRGDANVVWDLMPLDRRGVERTCDAVSAILGVDIAK